MNDTAVINASAIKLLVIFFRTNLLSSRARASGPTEPPIEIPNHRRLLDDPLDLDESEILGIIPKSIGKAAKVKKP